MIFLLSKLSQYIRFFWLRTRNTNLFISFVSDQRLTEKTFEFWNWLIKNTAYTIVQTVKSIQSRHGIKSSDIMKLTRQTRNFISHASLKDKQCKIKKFHLKVPTTISTIIRGQNNTYKKYQGTTYNVVSKVSIPAP